MTPRAHQQGFTLLEVVVAFVVLALILGSVFQAFTTGLSRTADLDEYSTALNVAQTKLAAAGVEEVVKEGEARGETADRKYQWSVKTARYQEVPVANAGANPTATFALYRIESTVMWRASDTRDRHVRLATITLGPPQQ